MFNEVGIEKIETSVAIVNPASWKIMGKLGFHRILAIKKAKYTLLPYEMDCYCYEVTKDEYIK